MRQDNSEVEPLVWTPSSNYGTESVIVNEPTDSRPKRQIGVVSVVFIIFNRLIGTGCDIIGFIFFYKIYINGNATIRIFATPSTVLKFSGSIGLSL